MPPEKPGDGKYAHLILNRNGDFLGVKPGFNRDGTKIADNPPPQILLNGIDIENVD